MGSIATTTPVIVGVGQINQRPEDLSDSVEPYRLMARAIRRADADAGFALASKADLIAVVDGAWRYSDPGRLLAQDLGASTASTALTTAGGQAPMATLGHLAQQIRAGRLTCAVLTGGETIWSRRRMRRQGLEMAITDQGAAAPDHTLGTPLDMFTPFEEQRGINLPIVVYPLFESALRHRNGETVNDHRDRISRLWARFNAVAADNPNAWSPEPMTHGEIRRDSAANRMVGFPYTKAMNSNWDLDQASAILITSVETARRAGISTDRWIFPHATAEANDTAAVSNRRDFHSSPAIGAAGAALLTERGVDSGQLAAVDLYSCFPSAVQIAAAELGLDLGRDLTVTGGLTFAGGPLNNYVGHSIAAMVDRLRELPSGSLGLVTANGGFITKHALGLFGNEPPPTGFERLDAQQQAEAIDPVAVDPDHCGPVVIEAYTVLHERNGSRQGRCALRTPDHHRTWGVVDDDAALDELTSAEGVGRTGALDAAGLLSPD